MKYLILIFTVLTFMSCHDISGNNVSENRTFKIIEVDGCEYIIANEVPFSHRGYGYMAHKGNCKYCQVRLEVTLERLNSH